MAFLISMSSSWQALNPHATLRGLTASAGCCVEGRARPNGTVRRCAKSVLCRRKVRKAVALQKRAFEPGARQWYRLDFHRPPLCIPALGLINSNPKFQVPAWLGAVSGAVPQSPQSAARRRRRPSRHVFGSLVVCRHGTVQRYGGHRWTPLRPSISHQCQGLRA